MKLTFDSTNPPQPAFVNNFTDSEVNPEFIVLHHTAVSLTETLAIFNRHECGSSHLVIDRDGATYECVPCWNGKTLKAWHAGISAYELNNKKYENLNSASIGIELVNLNGNIFEYTEAQYYSLAQIIKHLASVYPALLEPTRIIGHEDIAGFRGKCDPGIKFDWQKLFEKAFGRKIKKDSKFIVDDSVIAKLRAAYSLVPEKLLWKNGQLASFFSSLCELNIACSVSSLEQQKIEYKTKITDHLQKLKSMLHSLGLKEAANKLSQIDF